VQLPDEEVDQLLGEAGLQPERDFRFSVGDCFYDAISFLTRTHTHSNGQLEPLSMEQVRTRTAGALASATRGSVMHEYRQSLQDERAGTWAQKNRRAINKYVHAIGTPAGQQRGRLAGWADIKAVGITARALQINIYCHYADGRTASTLLGGLSGQAGRNWPAYHVLFEGPTEAGHYMPCTRVAHAAIDLLSPPRAGDRRQEEEPGSPIDLAREPSEHSPPPRANSPHQPALSLSLGNYKHDSKSKPIAANTL
jgi:hypothetical protein